MRKRNGELMRQLAAAIFLSALAIAAMMGIVGSAGAADLSQSSGGMDIVSACPPRETVVLFEEHFGILYRDGTPTVPARTPYFTCVTGTVLVPGDIPPPPEYCCS
jgi:hypothetical protein